MTPEHALQLKDLKELKQHLKMEFVMRSYGHEPDSGGEGKLFYFSPFRDDERASFDVFSQTIGRDTEPSERYGDRASSMPDGDVFDLIGKFEPALSLPATYDKARDLLAEQIRSDWEPSVDIKSQALQAFHPSQLEVLMEYSRPVEGTPIWQEVISTRPALVDAVMPADRLRYDPRSGTLVFVLKNEFGEAVGARLRYPEVDGVSRKQAIVNSKQALMRMEDPSTKPVFLTEGETDLYAAWAVLQDDYEVLGVPGVGNLPEKLAGSYLDGREVTIAFDGDAAGLEGMLAWASYLGTRGCTVRVAILPDGKDISELQAERIKLLPARTRVLPPAPDKIARSSDQFVWFKGEDAEAISNWSFEPLSVLAGEDGTRSYQGLLNPGARPVVLPDAALSSKATLISWGRAHQARWFGSDTQVQGLAALLDHEAAFLPEGRQTSQVGLHEGTFVWPSGTIGPDPTFYAPPTLDPGFTSSMFFIKDRPVDRIAVFEAMYNSQNHAVTGPILAWLAAAPLRSRFPQFPVLNVSGASGSGKSTLIEHLVAAFSGSDISVNLTSTTPHGVHGLINSSNGFPVRFDEYRPGARKTAKDALDQTLRDAYDGATSAKGGQATDKNVVSRIRTNCPIIVTGEDDFQEVSHLDRMVLVRLMKSEQGNLGVLQDLDSSGFAHAYMASLQTTDAWIEEPPVYTSYHLAAKERTEFNLQVLEVGWWNLNRFLQQQDPGYVIDRLDLSRVAETIASTKDSSPVLDLAQAIYEDSLFPNSGDTVWADDDYLYIRAQNLLNAHRNYPTIVLPGSNTRTVSGVLEDSHGFEACRVYKNGQQVRAHRAPHSSVVWVSPP